MKIDGIFDNIFEIAFWAFVIFSIFRKKKKKFDLASGKTAQQLADEEYGLVTNEVKNQETQNVSTPTVSTPTATTIVSDRIEIGGLLGAIVNSPAVRQAIQQAQSSNQMMQLQSAFAVSTASAKATPLDKKQKYLQIALNNTIEDAKQILGQLPNADRILVEAGTPLIKKYGLDVIRTIKMHSRRSAYVVADLKTADMGEREVRLAATAGADGVVALGVAPIETLDAFIAECQKQKVDAMIDMMNVASPLEILQKLKLLPQVVILHRGVDETDADKTKFIPYYQINQIKGMYNVMIAVAGGDSEKDIESAVFNGANIVVLWKHFYKFDGNVGALAQEFLQEVK